MSLYMLRELIFSMKPKAWILLSIGMVLWIFLFISISAISVVTEPEDIRQGVRFWVITDEDLTQSELENVHELLSTAAEVSHVRYDFSGSREHFEVTLQPGISADPVMERLRAWEGVSAVTLPQAESVGTLKLFAENPQNRNWLIGFGLLFWLAGFVLIRWGLLEVRKNFAGEIEMLELAGVGAKKLRTPFLLLGLVITLVGAFITGVLSFTAIIWVPVFPAASNLLRELLLPGMMQLMALRGVLLVIAAGGLFCILLGLLTYRYPKPFSLSRISSSSVAVRDR